MDINEIPRGQLSTIILTSLLTGDKYGYEIIDDVAEKTAGEVLIKKPSLYSSLSRMESQDLISSYWKDSDIGGRRHYYRLTDYGRKQVLQWQDELLNSQTKISKILNENLTSKVVETPKQKITEVDENQEKQIEEQPVLEEKQSYILQQENLFSLTKKDEPKEETLQIKADQKEKKNDDFIQYDLFSQNSYVSYSSSKSEVDKQQQNQTLFAVNEQIDLPVTPKKVIIQEEEKPEEDVLDNQFEIDLQTMEDRYTHEDDDALPAKKEIVTKGEPMLFNLSTFEGSNENPTNEETTRVIEPEPESKDDKEVKEEKDEKVKSVEEKLFKAAQNNFNIENEFSQYTRLTPSYFDTQKRVKAKSTPQPFSFEPNLDNVNFNKPKQYEDIDSTDELFDNLKNDYSKSYYAQNNNKQSPAEQNDSFVNFDQIEQDYEVKQEIDDEDLEEHISEKLDDAVLITAKQSDEQVPKVKKIAPASFSHIQSQRFELKKELKPTETNVVKPKVNEQETFQTGFEEEALDEKQTYQVLKDYYKEKNIKLSTYDRGSNLLNRELMPDEIKINKFNFFNSLLIFILSFVEVATCFFVLNHFSLINSTSYYYIFGILGIVLVYFLTYLTIYLKNPHKIIFKNELKQKPLWLKLVLICIFALLIYAVNMIFGMTQNNILDYLSSFALPCVILLNFLILHFVKMFKLN